MNALELFKNSSLVFTECQSYHQIWESQLICSANEFTGFYIMATLAFDELNSLIQGNKQTKERNAFDKHIHTLKWVLVH